MMRAGTLAELPRTPTSHDPDILKQVLVDAASGVPGLMQLAVTRLDPGQRVEPHAHRDLWEIFLIRRGVVEIRVNDDVHMLEGDQWIVVPPPAVHSVACGGRDHAEMLVIALAGDPPPNGTFG